MRQLLPLSLIIAIAGCFSKEPEKTGMEGKPMPSFKLLLTDSITYFDTKNIPSGKPSVFFYFGPNCPYSKTQMKEIIDDINDLKDIQFYVFTTWPFRDMKNFINNFHLNKYPNITTGIDYTNFFSDYFQVPGVPYLAIYGKDKKLNRAFVGKVYSNQIKKVSTY